MITEEDFVFYKQFLDRSSGYNLYRDKLYFLESRLQEVVRSKKLRDVNEIRHNLQREPNGQMAQHVIEAMTVNETFFFRDQTPYHYFADTMLPELMKRVGGRPLRIWSAACSTGQEPYSLGILLHEKRLQYPQLSWEIIATDINSRILAKARSGLFSELEVHRGLTEQLRQSYFRKDGSQWRIDEGIQRRVQFRLHNLREPMEAGHSFDVVFLRNVLIYFDHATRARVIANIRKAMHPEGYLLLGAAEHLSEEEQDFNRCRDMRGLYRRENQPL